MKILGLNGWTERGHDGGCSLLVDGKLEIAIEEERLIGMRHAYDRIPHESIKMVLDNRNITVKDIDKVAIGWDYPTLWNMMGREFISKEEMSKELFGTEEYANKITYIEHHIAHANSAFYPSGFEKSLVLVIDGQGEYIATSIFLGDRQEKKITKLYETPISLGYFYSAITEHIGFFSGQEGKTMGLASYGKPEYLKELREHLYADDFGNIHCSFKVEKKSKDEENETIERWHEILSKIIPCRDGKIIDIDDSIMPYANLAASAQKLLEEIIVKLVTYYSKKFSMNKIAIAGGVGLNCAVSQVLLELPFIEELFTQPAANDGGISLGAAIAVATENSEDVNFTMIPYQGNQFSDFEILEVLNDMNCEYRKSECISKEIAHLLANGNIVANFQGRLEFGPRALGNRSLLADPRKKEMLIRLNELKGREVWRPIAPAVLYEEQEKYFKNTQFSPYMTINSRVLPEAQLKLEAVTHVDGTARIQSVVKEYNWLFYSIIEEFYKITGIPVIINTSFNVKGEPIVDNPRRAIESAKHMKLDFLAIGNYIVKL